MKFSDADIRRLLERGTIKIEPMPDLKVALGTCSVDLQLRGDVTLPPHGFQLASTIEFVTLPDHIIGELRGRSSVARLGVGVHITAGIIDAGFEGNIVLELVNNSSVPVTLHHGRRVCALTFEPLSSPTTRPYNQRENAKYKGQDGVVGSRLDQDTD